MMAVHTEESKTSQEVGLVVGEIVHRLESVLIDLKATDVVTLDVSEMGAIADRFVIASGRSSRHVRALGDRVLDWLKCLGISARAEGLSRGEWVLIDAGDLVVHVFFPELRDYYQIERLWSQNVPGEKSDTGSGVDPVSAPRGAGQLAG